MNVEDIACKISVIFSIQHDPRDPISGVHVSPGSAETLARGGGITNHYLIACSLSKISAKNYQNRLMCVEVIVCYISVVFETQCSINGHFLNTVSEVRDLDVVVDNSLKFDKHISLIVQKAQQQAGLMLKCFCSRDRHLYFH